MPKYSKRYYNDVAEILAHRYFYAVLPEQKATIRQVANDFIILFDNDDQEFDIDKFRDYFNELVTQGVKDDN